MDSKCKGRTMSESDAIKKYNKMIGEIELELEFFNLERKIKELYKDEKYKKRIGDIDDLLMLVASKKQNATRCDPFKLR